jgi:hypothetical protein
VDAPVSCSGGNSPEANPEVRIFYGGIITEAKGHSLRLAEHLIRKSFFSEEHLSFLESGPFIGCHLVPLLRWV